MSIIEEEEKRIGVSYVLLFTPKDVHAALMMESVLRLGAAAVDAL